jgi:hypothetical protein
MARVCAQCADRGLVREVAITTGDPHVRQELVATGWLRNA